MASKPGAECRLSLTSGSKACRLFEVVERLPDPPTRDITRREALREMERQGIDALLVVDDGRRIRGVLSREMVLAQLMLALAED